MVKTNAPSDTNPIRNHDLLFLISFLQQKEYY